MKKTSFTLLLGMVMAFGLAAQKPEATIRKASVAPVLDGVIDEVWNEADPGNAISLPYRSDIPTLGDSGDTYWRALWTGTHDTPEELYLLLVVKDDDFYPSYAADGVNTWEYDCPEIFLDVNSVLEDGLGTKDDESGHHYFAPEFVEGKTSGEVLDDNWGGSFAIKANDPDYVVEYYIPLSQLKTGEDYSPDYGAALGFDMVVIDRDRDGGLRNRAVWANTGTVGENWSTMDDAGLVYFSGSERQILIEEITLESGATIDEDNGKLTLGWTVSPANANESELRWSLQNASGQARIDASSGEITGLVDGTVTVIVESQNTADTVEVVISNQFVTRPDLNLIRNGYFDEMNKDGSAAEWEGYNNLGDGQMFLFNNEGIHENVWDYTVSQDEFGCDSGELYFLSFEMNSSNPDTVNIAFDDPAHSWNRYGSSTHEYVNPLYPGRADWLFLSPTTRTRYTFDVRFDQLLSDTRESLKIMLGHHEGVLNIDSVELIRARDLKLLSGVFNPSEYACRSRDRLVGLYEFNWDLEDECEVLPDAILHNLDLADDRFCQEEKALAVTTGASYLEIPDHDSIDYMNEFSIAFWLYLDSIPSKETVILAKGDQNAPEGAAFWISTLPHAEGPDIPWSFSYRDADGIVHECRSEHGLTVNQWTPYTITCDGSQIAMYSDLEPLAIYDMGPAIQSNDHSLWFGDPSGTAWTGMLDELVFYRRALSLEEVEQYVLQQFDWTNSTSSTIEICPGNSVELKCKAKGPYIIYTFIKDGEILQEGPKSSYLAEVRSTQDLGSYTCIAGNCFREQKVSFDLELKCEIGELVILDQPREIQAYPGDHPEFTLEVAGTGPSTTYTWLHNGTPTDQNYLSFVVYKMSAADTGIYVCEIMDGSHMIVSDPIHVQMLDPQSRPAADTSGLRAWYTFEGDYADRTRYTGPGSAIDLVRDTGVYGQAGQADLFRGSNATLEIPDDEDLDQEGPFTLMLMFRMDEIPGSSVPIVTKGAVDGSLNYALLVGPDMNPAFMVNDNSGNSHILNSGHQLELSTWYILTASYDGENLNCYLNDVPGQTLPLDSVALQSNDASLIIGNLPADKGAMLVDEFRLYSKALSADEVIDMSRGFMVQMGLGANSKHELCLGETASLYARYYGPFVNYEFSREGEILQSGPSSTLLLPISTEEDYGEYQVVASNGFNSWSDSYLVKSYLAVEDVNIRIYEVYEPDIYASPGDQVKIAISTGGFIEGLEYRMYHNGNPVEGTPRNSLTFDNVQPEDGGEYYLEIMNGCERHISDTIHLHIQGLEFVEFEVPGWDWTGQIAGSGNSSFTGIALAPDGGFGLLGYFSGGLRVEGTEVFSSVKDDIFIVKYNKQGVYQWSKFLTGTNYKGQADLAIDSQGNTYICGSFSEELNVYGKTLNNSDNTRGFVAKLDTGGDTVWIKTIQSSRSLECPQIKIDAQDRVYLGGNFTGSLTIGNQSVAGSWHEYSQVMFLSQLDKLGNCQWIRHAVVNDMDMFGLVDLELSSNGDPVVCGTYISTADFGGGISLSTPVEAPFLVKYNAQGTPLWGTTISTDFGFAEAFDLSVDDLDRIFMTGMHLGDFGFGDHHVQVREDANTEIFLARFDPQGICNSLSSYGSTGGGDDFGICYEPESDTTGYLMGMFGDTLIMGNDMLLAAAYDGSPFISANMFIARLRDNGENLSLRSAGVKSDRYLGEIEVGDDGRLFFAGLNSFDVFEKSTSGQTRTIAFAAYRDNGLQPQGILEKRVQETICQGDSLQYMGTWCREAGEYEFVIPGVAGADTLLTLELSTEICSGLGNDALQAGIRIYPNPATQTLHLEASDGKSFDLAMYDMNARLLSRRSGRANYALDVSAFPSGLYLLQLKQGDNVYLEKIMIR